MLYNLLCGAPLISVQPTVCFVSAGAIAVGIDPIALRLFKKKRKSKPSQAIRVNTRRSQEERYLLALACVQTSVTAGGTYNAK
jgi:hypothetical protein